MSEALTTTALVALIAVFGYMNAWFLVAIIARRNDVADIAWGLGFVLVALTSLVFNQNFNTTTLLTTLLVTFWGIRLSWHIASRNIKQPEDYRYKAWRETWGSWFYVRSYLQVFIVQGIFLLLVSTPILVIMTYATEGISLAIIFGLFVWLLGFVFESVADKQLRDFVRNPKHKGRIMTTGLWHYTRHPNYFGEITQWWGIGIIALSCSYGWIGLIGPIVITFLIVKISGVPLLEQKYANNPSYQQYKKQTPMLIPFIK